MSRVYHRSDNKVELWERDYYNDKTPRYVVIDITSDTNKIVAEVDYFASAYKEYNHY